MSEVPLYSRRCRPRLLEWFQGKRRGRGSSRRGRSFCGRGYVAAIGEVYRGTSPIRNSAPLRPYSRVSRGRPRGVGRNPEPNTLAARVLRSGAGPIGDVNLVC